MHVHILVQADVLMGRLELWLNCLISLLFGELKGNALISFARIAIGDLSDNLGNHF